MKKVIDNRHSVKNSSAVETGAPDSGSTKRAILIVRVSSDSQFEKNSIEGQRSELIEHAIQHGGYTLEQLEIIESDGGESATKLELLKRPTIKKLDALTDSPQNTIESVYVYSLDRLVRNVKEYLNLRDDFFLKRKINFISKSQPILNITQNESPQSIIIHANFGAIAEYEGLLRIERIKTGKKTKRAAQCYTGGQRPFGYTFKRQNKVNNIIIEVETLHDTQFVPHPVESKCIYDIFSIYSQGNIGQRILYDKIKIKYPSIKLEFSTLANILRNPIYAGIPSVEKQILINDKIVTFHSRTYPAIISKEMFDKCEKIRNANNKNLTKSKIVYYSHRLIKCNCCNGFLIPLKPRMRYSCGNSWDPRQSKVKCNAPDAININVIDFLVWKYTKKLYALNLIQSNENDKTRIENEIKDKQIEIDNNKKIYELKIEDAIKKLSSKNRTYAEKRAFILPDLEEDQKAMINKNNVLTDMIHNLNIQLKKYENKKEDYHHFFKDGGDQSPKNIEEVAKSIIKTDSEIKEIVKQYISEVRIFNETNGVKRIEIKPHGEGSPAIYYYAAMKKDPKKRLYFKPPFDKPDPEDYIEYTERFTK